MKANKLFLCEFIQCLLYLPTHVRDLLAIITRAEEKKKKKECGHNLKNNKSSMNVLVEQHSSLQTLATQPVLRSLVKIKQLY